MSTNEHRAPEYLAQVEKFRRQHRTGLVTLVFTDLVESTRLKQALGDHAGTALIQQHRALVRELLGRFPESAEIETAGDSFLLMFSKPSEAVTFGLWLLHRQEKLEESAGRPVPLRMGIHLGEVVIEEHAAGQKAKDLYGIQLDICARVMSLAKANQVLMSRGVFDSARQVLKGEDIGRVGSLEWLNHGPYLLKGLEEPIEVCEVREAGKAAAGPPTSSEKAQRQVRAEGEAVLGWRPALGQEVPHTKWLLEKKLGEGGFGEVWLGRHQTMKERRVFKFCFRADRVRSLKREMTLFRVLKERIGDHPNIVRLLEVYFEEPPFYVVMDHVEGEDLKTWCDQQGGAEKVPLTIRFEIVAQIADALQAAHDAGVIHRDVKPANILVGSQRSEVAGQKSGIRGQRSGDSDQTADLRPPGAKLTDFGIGQVVSEEALKGITKVGFTQTIVAESSSSQTGSQMYMAPELLAGKPASIRSDIYSLGVVLYQLLVGDFTRPITTDWQQEVTDPLLCDDLKHCFAGNPQDRFAGAGQLAKNLRGLPERRVEWERRAAEKAALEHAAYRRGVIRAASLAAGIVVIMAVLAIVALTQSHRAKAAATAERHERIISQRHLYVANMNLVQQAWEQNNVGQVRRLLEETATYPDRGFEWYYWQRQTHQELKTLRGHADAVDCVAFSPDGRRIVTGSFDCTAKVWETANGSELLTLKGHGAELRSVAFSPDGRRIVTGSNDRTAKVWEAGSGEELLPLKGHSGTVQSVAFSPDGRRIVTGSHDSTAKVWEAASGKELFTLTGHSNVLWSVAFSLDGRRIVTRALDQAKVWDAASGKELFSSTWLSAGNYIEAVSPDGQRIVTSNGDHVKVWEADTGKELLTFKGNSAQIWAADFSLDGRRIVTRGSDQPPKVWDAASGQKLFALRGHSAYIWSAAFSPDGRRIATGSWDRTAKVWDAASGSEPITLRGHSQGIRSVAFSPAGRQIVTGSADHMAKVWELASGQELFALRGHSDRIFSAAFSPDGQRIVTGSADQLAKVWDAAGGPELFALRGHSAEIWSVAFSPDGQRVVTGSADQTAKVWETATHKELLTLTGHTAGIRSVAFSPDGQRIVTGSLDRMAKVWATAGGKELFPLNGHSNQVNAVVFSSDGYRIVTGSEDQTAKVWEAVGGRELLTLTGHSAGIWAVAFSPDGQRIMTGSQDGTTKVWEAASGRELLTLKGAADGIWSVACSPDGHRIVTGAEDGIATIWEAPTPRQVAAWQREEKAVTEQLAVRRNEQARATAHERALRVQDPGAIKQWLVLAPIGFDYQMGLFAALSQEQIPQEANLRPRAGERVKVSEGERVWRQIQLEDYLIDFNVLLGELTEWSVGYAVCYIQSATAQAGLTMKVGSDDAARVYLNGKETYQWRQNRIWMPDQDEVRGVELKAGLNVLVFKVVNGQAYWQGSIRFTDAAGQPLKGITVSLTP